MTNPIYTIKNFYKSLRNLVEWFPVIWQDRDWDHEFIYTILQKKLTRMVLHFETEGHGENSNKLKYMKICVKLLKRIREDDGFNFTHGMITKVEWFPCDNNPDLFHMISTKSVSDETFLKACQKERTLRQKYVKTLFNILGNRVERFWD